MSKTWLKLLAGAALLVLFSVPAHADSIVTFNNGNGCGGSNCFGNNITLLIHPTGANAYTITLTIDTTGNTNTGVGIAAVNFKLDSGGGVTAASLTSAPGGTAGWTTLVATGLNASTACTSGNGASFGCSEDTAFWNFSVTQPTANTPPTFPTALASLPNAGTYQWVWTATTGAAYNDVTDSVHVGVLFGKQDTLTKGCGKNCSNTTYSIQGNGIISASGLGSTVPPPPNSPVPEPGSLALLGTGLVGIAGIIRRRISG